MAVAGENRSDESFKDVMSEMLQSLRWGEIARSKSRIASDLKRAIRIAGVPAI